MLCKQTWGKKVFRGTALEGTKLLLAEHASHFKADDYRLGKTKIFLRQPTTLFWLEEQREAALPPIVTKMQAVWRGYRARRRFNRIKACLKIVYAIRAYKSRKWLMQVIATFKNVKTDPNLGKTTPWPPAPPALQTARTLLGKVHATWRAHTMLKRWNAKEQAYLRQKCLAFTVFRGKKPYQLQRHYEADYLSAQSNPHRTKYTQAVQVLFQKFGDTQILFADEVLKANRGGRTEARACIVTDQNIYKADPKSYKLKSFEGSPKAGIPLAHIVGLSMSPHPDRWVVCHSKDSVRDFVICVGTYNNDKLSEFVTSLMTQYQKQVGKPLPVAFKDQIQYNNSSKLGELTTLSFTSAPDDKTSAGSFKKGKGTACVAFNPNPGPASPRT
jgi:myosin I